MKKILQYLMTIFCITPFILFILFSIFILINILSIGDGYSGKRTINEYERKEIADFLEKYYSSNNRKEYVFKNKINENILVIPNETEVVLKWEMLDTSFFVKHIFDDPVDNQYVVDVKVNYKNEGIKTEVFRLVKKQEVWKILWVYQ